MNYRPQYAYAPAPRGYRDEDFFYSFDGLNTISLSAGIPANQFLRDIVLRLDRDAPFLWRGTKILTDQQSLGVEFYTPDGERMSDTYAPVEQSYFPSGDIVVGSTPIPMEREVPCPLGAVILLDLANFAAVPIVEPRTAVLLFGVKRWKIEVSQ